MNARRTIFEDVIEIFFVVLFSSILVSAQNNSGTDGSNFRGLVRLADNSPAPFVKVELWTDGESTWRTYVDTDRMGRFQTGAPCMIIQYKIEIPNYRPIWGRVDMSINPCRASESMTLIPLPGKQPAEVPASGSVSARIAAIPPEAKREFDAGRKAINENDFAGSIPHLQKAINAYPKYAEAYQLLGVAQLQTDQGPQAEASLLKAIDIEDGMPRAQYLLGVLYAKTGRPGLAEKPFSRFVELDPQNPNAHFELAKVSYALNKYSDAETHAHKSIELKETDPGVHVVLGYALLRQKRALDAKEEFQLFLSRVPQGPMASDVRDVVAQIDQRLNK